jgi:photosystem II stability/assembly factor-like uncharacterized protein
MRTGFLVIIVLLFKSVFPQDNGWIMQESGISNSLRDIFTIDENHAWAVGDSGVIVRTIDGGETWEHQFAPFDLSCIWFMDANTGIAAGNSEYLLRTQDGGMNWYQLSPGLFTAYEDISFIGPLNGWIIGNPGQAILKTSDAGLTWEDMSIGNNDEWLMSIEFADPLNGWLLGRNYCEDIYDAAYFFVSKTADGGLSWQRMKTFGHSNDTDKYMQDLSVTDADHCWVAAAEYFIPYLMWYGMTYYTSNGGSSWIERGNYGVSLSSLYFADPVHGWTVGDQSIFFVNAIVQFPELQFEDQNEWFNCIYFSDTLNGWAAGENGTIMHTTNGGTVDVPSLSFQGDPDFMIFPNPSTGFINVKVNDLTGNLFVTAKLFDLAGREIAIHLINNGDINTFGIIVCNPVPGIYMLEIDTGKAIYTGKVMLY